MNKRKLLQKILTSPQNISFGDFVVIVVAFGFRYSRTNGSHHIYTHPDVPMLLNLQNVNGEAKPYQIRQFLKLVEQYNLEMED